MAYDIFLRLYTQEYYQALGRFVTEFTEIECSMQIALWRLSNVKTPVAQAVFSGVRADDACNKISRISEAENWPETRRAEWKVVADRLGILRTLRNDILHYGANWQPDGSWIVTNKDYVHASHKVKNTPVTVTVLADASDDLQRLSLRLFRFLFADEMSEKGLRNLDQGLRIAWRYIPPPQEGRRNNSPGNDPKHPRPPRPSSASKRKAALERLKKT
jgi:hypothetical protein